MTLPTMQQIKDALSAFNARLKADLSFMWQEDRVFLFIFAIIIAIAKGSSLLISFWTMRSKQEVNAATKQNAVLQAQETAANDQANALIKQANELPAQQMPVNENWDKKK